MNIFLQNTLCIYSTSSLHREMIKLTLTQKFNKIISFDLFEDLIKSSSDDAICILDDTEENHDQILDCLKDQAFAKKCLILIDCARKQAIRSFVSYKIGAIISYKTALRELGHAIESLFQEKIYFSERIKANLLEEIFSSKVSKLTPKESEIVTLFGRGLSTHEISLILKCSPMTINVHRVNIKKKLGLTKNNQFIKYCIDFLNY